MAGLLRALLSVAHLLSLSLWGGGAVFFSFLITPRIFSFLRHEAAFGPPAGWLGTDEQAARRLAGDVVGAVFPGYFAAQIILGCLAVATAVLLAWHAGRLGRIRGHALLAALVIVCVHRFSLYPRTLQVRRTYYEALADGNRPLAMEHWGHFQTMHGISQAINLLTIVLLLLSVVLTGIALERRGRSQATSAQGTAPEPSD